uniref:Uncharacterized protein n=1 Tax=Anguilla anguilla TaxID=7936 RepID=A0A0E9VGR8_ANGAN
MPLFSSFHLTNISVCTSKIRIPPCVRVHAFPHSLWPTFLVLQPT